MFADKDYDNKTVLAFIDIFVQSINCCSRKISYHWLSKVKLYHNLIMEVLQEFQALISKNAVAYCAFQRKISPNCPMFGVLNVLK